MKTKLNTTQKLVLSAIMMALYIAILFLSQAISFGAVQMRLATALYGLTYIFPFLVFPISLANAIANSFGGLGLIDVVGGFCASFLTTGSIYLIRKAKLSSWFIILPILLVPALVVPIWLSALELSLYENWLNEDIKTDKQKYLCTLQRYFLVIKSFFVSFSWCQFVTRDKQTVVNISRIFLILINPILIHFEVKIISSQLS